jgi:hypothetical protein
MWYWMMAVLFAVVTFLVACPASKEPAPAPKDQQEMKAGEKADDKSKTKEAKEKAKEEKKEEM